MASGVGRKGNVGRCFHAYNDFESCAENSQRGECRTQLMDYLHCLHPNTNSQKTRLEVNENKNKNL
jgi:hypothetical protein